MRKRPSARDRARGLVDTFALGASACGGVTTGAHEPVACPTTEGGDA